MTKKSFIALITLLAAFCCAAGFIVSASQRQSALDKLAPWVMTHTADGKQAECLVIMAAQADLAAADSLRTKAEKGRYVYDRLLAQAARTQAPLLGWLRARGVEHRSFYLVNAVWVKGDRALAEEIAARADVARIEGNPRIRNLAPAQPTPEELDEAIAAATRLAPEAIEPGVNFIRAPEVWAQGFTGQGIVIAGADTGIRWDHPALLNRYRGWNGATADHNYNWHDSIHSGGGVCGPNTAAPCDDDNHGTHTIGSAVGSDDGANQIGVAPGAKFIGCRNMDQGNGTPATYIECMEWFLAPYPIGGTPAQGDPSKAPDITTNSWGCPPSEGCGVATLQQAVEGQRAAGIMMVVAAGNSGSACATVSDPPSFYAASYTVGAISSATGTIASFSSRGPATLDGSNRLKPEITAPGVGVRSSIRSGGYSSFSGTSMATPHTAGAIALLWSARPELRHQIQATINLVNPAAVDVSSVSCNSGGVPNNVYGWGRLDIKAAVDAAGGCSGLTLSPSSPLSNGTLGAAYNQAITAAGGTAPYSFAVTAGALPAGLMLTGGALGGAPTAIGTFNFTVTATDANNCSGTRAYALTINCGPLTVGPATLLNGAVGVPYQQPLTQTGGVGALTWSNTGTLPNGLLLHAATGVLAGMPTTQGIFTFTIRATDGSGCFGERAYAVGVSGTGLMFYPLPRPLRLLDTRAGGPCDNISTPITGGATLTTQARVNCDGITIPATAQAVVGNVTALNQTAAFGFLTLFPAGQSLPLAANLIYEPGQSLANNFTVAFNADGEFSLFAERTLHAVIDVSGYFAPPTPSGLYYHALPQPLRLLDTRAGQSLCDNVGTSIAAGTALTTPARVSCNNITIPAAAQAVVGNATAINQSAQAGFLTLYPAGQPLPLAANMIYQPNQLLSNYFTVGLDANGRFDIFGERTLHAVIDVAGYYSAEAIDLNGAGLLFNPLPRPLRLLDTRANQGPCDSVGTPIAAGGTFTTQARVTCNGITIPASAQTVSGNITVLNQTAAFGFLTLFPAGQPLPLAANMIYAPGQLLSNAFVAGLSALGEFDTFGERTIHVVVDVSGYFAP